MAHTSVFFLLSWSLGYLGPYGSPFQLDQRGAGLQEIFPAFHVCLCVHLSVYPSLSIWFRCILHSQFQVYPTQPIYLRPQTSMNLSDSRQQTVDSRQQTVEGKGEGRRMKRKWRETIEPLEVCGFQHRYQRKCH